MTESWSGEERREGMSQIRIDLALIRQKTGFIEEKLIKIIADMEAVRKDLVSADLLKKTDLDEHTIQDRWMFGLMITMLIGILIKMVYQ